jgi:carboxypeptidase C (cathepsin A)
VVWLESPAGVGFSYSDNPADYNTNDTRTTADTYKFLQTFFTDLFPQYAKSRFYVTGESYGGHYVPLISYAVVEGNKDSSNTFINIQGLMEGMIVFV